MEQIDIIQSELDKVRERSHQHTNALLTQDLKIGQLQEAMIAAVELRATVTAWMTNTNEYRTTLCNKIDKLFKLYSDLPCKERGEMYKGMTLTAKLMWIAIGTTFGIVVAHLGWK